MGNVMDTLINRIKEMEREEIINAQKECDWVMAKTARMLGITEKMIGCKVRKYVLRIKEVRWTGDK